MRQTREETEETADRLAHMTSALVSRLRGQTPAGFAKIYDGCKLSTFEVLSTVANLSGGTGDFPLLMSEALEKRLLDHYRLENPPYRRLTRRVSLNSFRPSPLVAVEFPALAKVGEHAELKFGVLSESGELLALETWGRIVGLSRRVIVNDDLGAVDSLAQLVASAAISAENDLFFSTLMSGASANGPTLRDGVQLCHATHGNLMVAAALNATSLGLAVAAMRRQAGPAGSVMNIAPAFLLVGPSLEIAARQLLTDLTPAGTAPLELIVDAHLADASWYVWADPRLRPAFVHGRLSSADGPRLLARTGFALDGLEFLARTDIGIGPFEWRSIVRTPSAA